VDQQSHSVKPSYSQRRSEDVAAPRNTRRDSLEDEEYDDVWPSRMPTSTRRYQGDVRTEAGRATTDVLASQGGYKTSSNPGRTGGNTIPPRRTATQSMPAVQPSATRRAVTQSVPVAPSAAIRRAVTQNVPVTPPARRPPTQSMPTAAVQQARRRQFDDLDDPSQRTTALLKEPKSASGRRFHWLVYVGLAMVGMIVCWMLLTAFLAWWQVTQDDLRYGRPRTSQYEAVVGHGDSNTNKSHFIALNLNRHIEVIECPAGDCTKAHILIGPVLIGPNQDLAPVTLTFKDVNGDKKMDLVINVQDSHFVFINDNGTFRPTRAGDNFHL